MDISPIYFELSCVILGICLAGASFLCLKGETQVSFRQAIVSCALALIFLAQLVPELTTRFGFYRLSCVALLISVAGIRILLYGRRLQTDHDRLQRGPPSSS